MNYFCFLNWKRAGAYLLEFLYLKLRKRGAGGGCVASRVTCPQLPVPEVTHAYSGANNVTSRRVVSIAFGSGQLPGNTSRVTTFPENVDLHEVWKRVFQFGSSVVTQWQILSDVVTSQSPNFDKKNTFFDEYMLACESST